MGQHNSKSRQKQIEAKKKREKLIKPIIIILIIAAVITGIVFGIIALVSHFNQVEQYSEKQTAFETKLDKLYAELVADTETVNNAYKTEGGNYVVFLSSSDIKTTANVTNATGSTLEQAWKNAAEKMKDLLQKGLKESKWLKADVVITAEKGEKTALYNKIKSKTENYVRVGFSVDAEFEHAAMEASCNSSDIYNYSKATIGIDHFNDYLTTNGNTKVKEIPTEIYTFTTQGWLCDETDTIYKLETSEENYGRRTIDTVTAETALAAINSASSYLASQVQNDGRFIYGYKGTTGSTLSSYNILRHSGTIWSVMCNYILEKDESVLTILDKPLDFLLSQVVYQGDDKAFINEEKSNELKIGANGISIVALMEYMDEMNTDEYLDLCIKLGNGILEVQRADGSYYHVLSYPKFDEVEEFRTVYYDGECTFALALLYGATKDQKWLDAAKLAVDYFIANNYTQYKDHWVAYSVNELTKYCTDEKYFEFGLRNVNVNLDRFNTATRTTPTFMELMMAGFELYDRIKTDNIQVSYMSEFREEDFINTIYSRMNYMMNAYGYPEFVMYMGNPELFENTFFIRDDDFRIRIDDVQHCIGGFYRYYRNYDRIKSYADAFAG